MHLDRRTFLKSTVVLGSAASAEGMPPNLLASGKGRREATGNKFEPQWQSYVDSGIYPSRVHLLLDDLYIQRMEDTKRVVHPPKMVGDGPVMKAEKPWEG